MQKWTMLVLAVLGVVGGAAAAGDSWTVSGTFTRSAVADGTRVYLKLIDPGARCLDPDAGHYSTSATLTGGTASYTLEGVRDGEYTACAFIDLVQGEGTPNPDSGDLGAVRDVEVTHPTTLDFGEDDWMPLP
ncbi:MAG: hypothetical protein LJF15_19075 [Acidobacteria bacterium]|nr:hypothetical protein [Acidobacteriota bacterium]